MSCGILLTGFCNTSSERLLHHADSCDTLLLPNSKILDTECLIHAISENHYGLVICVGQKPNLKDKICIETTARDAGISIQTRIDCQELAKAFTVKGITARISHNAGTSFCNTLYYNGLHHITAHDTDTQLVFIHIPFEKNIREPIAFYRHFLNVINEWEGGTFLCKN